MLKPNLFQFWDSVPPPAEVVPLIASWEADQSFTYQRFTTATAQAFIAEHIGDRASRAFRQCANPAMQSDLFRYCALYCLGGIYVDADTSNKGNLATFVAAANTGILMQLPNGNFQNSFIFVREPGNSLLERMMASAIENIEQRISNNVWRVTGPAVMMHLRRRDTTGALFAGFDVRPSSEINRFVRFETGLAYRKGPKDWRYPRDHPEENISIFRDLDPQS